MDQQRFDEGLSLKADRLPVGCPEIDFQDFLSTILLFLFFDQITDVLSLVERHCARQKVKGDGTDAPAVGFLVPWQLVKDLGRYVSWYTMFGVQEGWLLIEQSRHSQLDPPNVCGLIQ